MKGIDSPEVKDRGEGSERYMDFEKLISLDDLGDTLGERDMVLTRSSRQKGMCT